MRTFGLTALVTAPLVAKEAAVEFSGKLTDQTPDVLLYRGWRVRWTGWKTSQTNIILLGQWVGFNQKPSGFRACYASSGGASNNIEMYGSVGLNIVDTSRYVDIDSSDEHKDSVRNITLAELKKFIDKHEG